jgi:hypothetical protein
MFASVCLSFLSDGRFDTYYDDYTTTGTYDYTTTGTSCSDSNLAAKHIGTNILKPSDIYG